MSDFLYELQKLAQKSDGGVEVYVDENGDIEFEVKLDVFLKQLEKYKEELKNE
tara:strand:+ start:6344 stop:6502 length:159 start_codon:yes stop_codon:yes gene_type:complete